jgi:hypothetical protein
MKKRIVISESEKQRILSQHKNVIKEESELKRQSLSEREMSKLINNVLINESKSDSAIKEAAGCNTSKDCKFPQKCNNGKCETTTALKETEDMDEALTKPTSTPSKVPGCLGGMTYCSSNNKCCPVGTCTSQGCMDPRTGKKIPGGSPIFESDEIIYEIEMDVEEIDETIYEIEMDEEVSESSPTGCIACFRRGKTCCRGSAGCCDFCGANDECGQRVKF